MREYRPVKRRVLSDWGPNELRRAYSAHGMSFFLFCFSLSFQEPFYRPISKLTFFLTNCSHPVSREYGPVTTWGKAFGLARLTTNAASIMVLVLILAALRNARQGKPPRSPRLVPRRRRRHHRRVAVVGTVAVRVLAVQVQQCRTRWHGHFYWA